MANREKLKFGELQGERVFIIGGGPSLKETLLDKGKELLEGKNIIVVNNAYKLYPNAFLLHFADSIWYSWHRDKLHTFKGKHITTCVSLTKEMTLLGIEKFNTNGSSIKEKDKTLCGNDSGSHAINIAYLSGASEIVLLGFDLDPKVIQKQWHKEHKRDTNAEMYYKKMIPTMNKMAEYFSKKYVKVWNCNPKSHLRCFPYKSLEQFL